MKKTRLFPVFAVCAAMLLAGCSNGTDEPATYTVTVTSGGNGSASADKTTAEAGTTVNLTATPDPGYDFVGWNVESGSVVLSSPTATPAFFTMPAGNVTVKAEFVIRGVLINGTIWALCNVDAPGTFAANPENSGMFYQWNRRIGWSTTDPLTSSPAGATWDSSSASGDEWEAANDPCPAGWRVPTHEEQVALCDAEKTTSEWTTLNGVNVRRFTDNVSGNSVFFPAAGYRDQFVGAVKTAGQFGVYWSATPSSASNARALVFNSDAVDYPLSGYSRADGYAVRCVAE